MHKYLNPEDEKRKDFTHLARYNRRAATDAERKMWRLLRGKRFSGFKFRRQHQLLVYIVDFVCLEKRLVIELDGGQHNQPDSASRDEQRTEALRRLGFTMLRFWNHQVLREGDVVREVIYAALHNGE